VNLVIGSGEGDGLLRPTQRLPWFGVHELELAAILAVPPPARAALQAANDHIDRPLGMLERAIGIACLRRGRRVALLVTIFRLAAVMSPIVTAIVVLASTSDVVAVVVVAV
jgi:hypothetical protein